METFTETFNLFAAAGTLVGQAAAVFVLVLWLAARSGKQSANRVLSTLGKHGITVAFLTALAATVSSLIYSNVIGFEPCELCWFQRIFLYPQVIVLGLALWKKARDAEIYCLWLSVIGALVAAYHYYGQSFNPSALPACDATGAASCAVRFFVEFGYITIPLMSFTAFLILVTSVLLARYSEKS